MLAGCFIRYATNITPLSHLSVVAAKSEEYNDSLPPDTLRFFFSSKDLHNRTYAYSFRGGLEKITGNAIDIKVMCEMITFRLPISNCNETS